MQTKDAISEISKIIATYNGETAVEVLDVTPDGGRCYVHALNGGQLFGFGGMWGGCESSSGWVPRDTITDVRLTDDTTDVLAVEPHQVGEEMAEFRGMLCSPAFVEEQ